MLTKMYPKAFSKSIFFLPNLRVDACPSIEKAKVYDTIFIRLSVFSFCYLLLLRLTLYWACFQLKDV